MGNIARAKQSAIFFTIFSRAQCIILALATWKRSGGVENVLLHFTFTDHENEVLTHKMHHF